MDKNGNRLEGECSHTQRDAKTPEIVRKFLLDVAKVFFPRNKYVQSVGYFSIVSIRRVIMR